MSTPQDVIAETLKDWRGMANLSEESAGAQAILDALTAAGYAVVRLPEPTQRTPRSDIWVFGTGAHSAIVEATDGRAFFEDLDVTRFTEQIAGALIAAGQAVTR